MRLLHDLGKALELQTDSGTLWRYEYGTKPKPFFHPLRTPAGYELTLFEPGDHFWHRGLWFTIKFVNGHNFWEENPPFGTQLTVKPPSVIHEQDGVISWYSELNWVCPDGSESVFFEERRISYSRLSNSSYALDWDVRLTAQSDLLLDRTPFTTWGGYGGLTFRGNRNWVRTNLLFSDGTTSDRPLGIPAKWCDLSGHFDGGRDAFGGVAIFDHPANPRHPSPWYGGTGSGHYFNAAFLFHEPMKLSAGEELHLRYRVLAHDGILSVEELEVGWDDYVGG